MKRAVSFSEVATLLECQARHDFAYVGQLAGSALKRREPHLRLREGRAWGKAVAALHSWDPEDPSPNRLQRGLEALRVAIAEDTEELRTAGVFDELTHNEHLHHLEEVLLHYAQTAAPLDITHPELELRLPIPSRGGSRASSRYEFHGYLDGLHRDEWGLWIVEYKLRTRLQGTAQVQLGRQYRQYAWAAGKALGEVIQGVIVDERLNQAPKPARMLKSGQPSHARDQMTTPDAYIRACREAGVEHDPAVAEVMAERKWQQRERVVFMASEMRDVEHEMRSAARLVSLFDRHVLFPIRNPSPQRCAGCAFRDICAAPQDHELVDALYERKPPKAEREATTA